MLAAYRQAAAARAAIADDVEQKAHLRQRFTVAGV